MLKGGLRRRHQGRGGRLLELAELSCWQGRWETGRVPAVQTQRPRRRPGVLHHRRDAGRARPQAPHAAGDRYCPHPREHPRHRTPHPGRASSGAGRSSSLLTAGSRRRKPAMPAGMCRTSDGPNIGNVMLVRERPTSATTTHLSTSHATRTLLASSAQLGPPSSAEPTVRPGLAGLVVVNRGREPAIRPGNNPEMGCESRDH